MEQTPTSDRSDKKTRIKLIISVILFLGILVSYYGWVKFWSPEAKAIRAYQEKYEKLTDFFEAHEDALRNDTYGGKTPEETLTMFTNALKKGDLDLASKYFTIDTNENSQYYLTTNEWKEALTKAVQLGRMEAMLRVLENVGSGEYGETYGAYRKKFEFQIRKANGELEAEIELVFNEKSGVWKINRF